MEWIIILLILILIALFAIERHLFHIIEILFNRGNNSDVASLQGHLSTISNQIEEIYKVLGGDLKDKDVKKKERADLKKRYVKQMILRNPTKSKKAINVEADRLFKDAEIYEMTKDSDTKFWSIESWVKGSEEWEWNNEKFGHLLDKARKFISDRSQINAVDIQEALNFDLNDNYEGVKWILGELESEGKIEKDIESQEYNERTGTYITKLWNVIKQ